MPCLGFATLSSRCSHAHPCRISIMFGLERLSARFARAGSTIMLVGDAYDCYDLRAPVVVARLQPSTTHELPTQAWPRPTACLSALHSMTCNPRLTTDSNCTSESLNRHRREHDFSSPLFSPGRGTPGHPLCVEAACT